MHAYLGLNVAEPKAPSACEPALRQDLPLLVPTAPKAVILQPKSQQEGSSDVLGLSGTGGPVLMPHP